VNVSAYNNISLGLFITSTKMNEAFSAIKARFSAYVQNVFDITHAHRNMNVGFSTLKASFSTVQ
jgi:hypothetical protein